MLKNVEILREKYHVMFTKEKKKWEKKHPHPKNQNKKYHKIWEWIDEKGIVKVKIWTKKSIKKDVKSTKKAAKNKEMFGQ